MRVLANIHFIGQLYKHHIVIDEIVHNSVIQLVEEVRHSVDCRGHLRMIHIVDFSSCTVCLGQGCGLVAEQHTSTTPVMLRG
jgi:hypothetical protein